MTTLAREDYTPPASSPTLEQQRDAYMRRCWELEERLEATHEADSSMGGLVAGFLLTVGALVGAAVVGLTWWLA